MMMKKLLKAVLIALAVTAAIPGMAFASTTKKSETKCTSCSGTGKTECTWCDGTGKLSFTGAPSYTCRACMGTGKRNCLKCSGTGTIKKTTESNTAKNNTTKNNKTKNSSVTVPITSGSLNFTGTHTKCPVCKGAGKKVCSMCSGNGFRETVNYSANYGYGSSKYWTKSRCAACNGTGLVPCTSCGGDGLN